jgi:hypothetical protein
VRFSPAAIPENLSHFIQEFPEVFLLQRWIFCPLWRMVNYTITLLDSEIVSNPRMFKVPDTYLPKFKKAITK